VVRLGGSSEGFLALVSDGDDAVLVLCPASATTWGPKHRGRYEFELNVPGAIASWGDAGAFDGHRPGAVATAVRPLD
jgi:hypothetical protein